VLLCQHVFRSVRAIFMVGLGCNAGWSEREWGPARPGRVLTRELLSPRCVRRDVGCGAGRDVLAWRRRDVIGVTSGVTSLVAAILKRAGLPPWHYRAVSFRDDSRSRHLIQFNAVYNIMGNWGLLDG
jgi:hypothetical protein